MQGRATSFELSSSVEAFGEFSWRVDLVVGGQSRYKQVYANWLKKIASLRGEASRKK